MGAGGEKADDPHMAAAYGDPTRVDGSRTRHDAGDAVASGARHEQGREDQRRCVMCELWYPPLPRRDDIESQRPSATEAATDLARLIEREG
jgi:hypothetical protein